MAQPHSLPICSGSGCICLGNPGLKPSPCFCILPKHTPAGATGSELLYFFAETTTLKCSTGKCYEIQIRNALHAFSISLSPLLCMGHLLSHPPCSFPFTLPLYIHAPFLPCYSLSPHSVISSTKSVPSATNWKNRAVISHTTGFSVSTAEQ